MSIQAVAWALDQYIPKPGPKLVLVVLANYADHADGKCFPKIKTIAHGTSLSERSVQRFIPELERQGFIKVERSFLDGRQRENVYWLLMPSTALRKPTRSDSVSPLQCGKRKGPDTLGGATAATPNNHYKNHQLPPLSPNAVDVDKPEDRHSSEEKRPSSRAAPPAPNKLNFETRPSFWKDRGRFETEIITRLGIDGGDMLSALPDWQVNSLCHRQRAGTLDDDAITEIKTTYLETKSRS